MRLATIMGIAVLGISTVGIAQVASSSAEQKTGQAGGQTPGNDMLMNDNSLTGPANAMTPTDEAMANMATEAEDSVPLDNATAPRRR